MPDCTHRLAISGWSLDRSSGTRRAATPCHRPAVVVVASAIGTSRKQPRPVAVWAGGRAAVGTGAVEVARPPMPTRDEDSPADEPSAQEEGKRLHPRYHVSEETWT
jgi:hypothetical protein